jgi:hypothetical protein
MRDAPQAALATVVLVALLVVLLVVLLGSLAVHGDPLANDASGQGKANTDHHGRGLHDPEAKRMQHGALLVLAVQSGEAAPEKESAIAVPAAKFERKLIGSARVERRVIPSPAPRRMALLTLVLSLSACGGGHEATPPPRAQQPTAGSMPPPPPSQSPAYAAQMAMQQEQTDKLEDDLLDAREKSTMRALRVTLGKEGASPGEAATESASAAARALRAANVKVRVEPVTDMSGAAMGQNLVILKDDLTDHLQHGGLTDADKRAIQKSMGRLPLRLAGLRNQIGLASGITFETNSNGSCSRRRRGSRR